MREERTTNNQCQIAPRWQEGHARTLIPAKSMGSQSDATNTHCQLIRSPEGLPKRVGRPAWAGNPKPLICIGWPVRPPAPHFYRPPLVHQPGHQPLTFIDGPWAGPAHLNPALLSTGPGQPKPLLLLARALASISQSRPHNPARRNPTAKRHATGTATPYLPRFEALPIWQTLTCHRCAAGLLLSKPAKRTRTARRG